MKNAMKKLMAFALVAVMLIGALPFGASAASPSTFSIEIKINSVPTHNTIGTAGLPVTIADCAAAAGVDPSLVTDAYYRFTSDSTATHVGADASFYLTGNVIVDVKVSEPEPEPKIVSLTVDYGNGTSANINVTVGEKIGYQNLPTNLEYDGYEFAGYILRGNGATYNVDHNTVAGEWDGWYITGHWNPVSCTECKWPIGEGHAAGCSLNPNKPSQTPENNPGTQDPAVTTAALRIFANNDKKYETVGTPNGAVSVADCLSCGNIDGSKVTAIRVSNGQTPAIDGSFTLGAAGTTTDIFFTVSTGTTTTPPATSTPSTGSAYAYIYVGNDSNATAIYKYDNAFSIAGAVNRFDAESNLHYAFAYYTMGGSAYQYTDNTAVVQPGQTAHIRVKVTESKLNDNKVYLQIYLNNDFDTPAKTLNVTTMASEDGLYLYGNVEDLILDYFTAKNSNGVKLDGMYESVGSWVANFLEDEKVSRLSADEVIEAKEKTFVVYNIMVTNAKLASSNANADTSNPKTGDQIFAPIAIMAVSACALAAVAFYLNKKRAM